MAYLSRGEGKANGDEVVRYGDLMRGESFSFQAGNDTQLIIVHTSQ